MRREKATKKVRNRCMYDDDDIEVKLINLRDKLQWIFIDFWYTNKTTMTIIIITTIDDDDDDDADDDGGIGVVKINVYIKKKNRTFKIATLFHFIIFLFTENQTFRFLNYDDLDHSSHLHWSLRALTVTHEE